MLPGAVNYWREQTIVLIKQGQDWGKAADVVIVGYGMAGAVAAITAHDLGAEVLIVDKQSVENFCTTSSLAGGIFITTSDVKRTINYVDRLNRISGDIYWTEPEVSQVWAEYIADNKNWMERLGAKIQLMATGAEHPEIPDWDSIQLWKYPGSGLAMMNFLYSQVSQRGIEVRHSTPARKLVTDMTGRVTGVRVEADGKQMDIGASRAVILTCGGFEFNERMKLNYLKVYPAYFRGSEANTGDGIRMALEVGADLWHMNCCSGRLVAKFPELPWAFGPDFGGKGWVHRLAKASTSPEPAGYILVDRQGKRFTNEDIKLHCAYYELDLFVSHGLTFPRIPTYWIFDQRRMESGALVQVNSGAAGPHQLYKWSRDNSVELGKGWIISARTVEELARKLDMEPGTLEKTLATYNRYCEKGQDPDFKRSPSGLISLESLPFYAVELWPGGSNTQGGPRRNARSQILNVDGDPIPGLYSAGELGSIYGLLYPSGGGNLAECIAFGRIAAENAVKERA